MRVPALARHRLADYPEMEFGLPHLPSLLNYLIANRIDLVQCSTPGPVGIMGLFAARLAGIPVVGQYHTDLPEYCTRITGDPMTGALVSKAVGWFYGAMDRVFVPSQAVAARVAELGVAAEKVARMPRGIDLDLFRASRRDPHAFAPFGLNGEPKVLYVGRLSREKSLDALIDAFELASPSVPEARLVIVGTGPYAQPLAARAASERVLFLGTRTGDELATLMASSDVFVSPSETETFGNTVVEAQASGLPVVVANRGAARENMLDEITGLVVDAREPQELAGGDLAVARRPPAARAHGRGGDRVRAPLRHGRRRRRNLRRIPALPRRARAGRRAPPTAPPERRCRRTTGGRSGARERSTPRPAAGPRGRRRSRNGRGRCVVRLVDITSFFPTSCGGIKRYYREKARVLPPRGIDCHFVAPGAALEEQELGRRHAAPAARAARAVQPGVPAVPARAAAICGGCCSGWRPTSSRSAVTTSCPTWCCARWGRSGRRWSASFTPTSRASWSSRWRSASCHRGWIETAVEMAWSFARRQFARYDASLVASREISEWLRGLGFPGVRWVGLGVDVDVFHPIEERRGAMRTRR